MIFPTPVNPKNYQAYPITWMLVFLNFFLFVLVFTNESNPSGDEIFFKEANLKRTGVYYHHMTNPADSLRQFSETQIMTWAMLAIKDKKFFLNVENMQPWGDVLEFAEWKKLAISFRDEYLTQASYRFGLSSQSRAPLNWVTYQFSHASWSHLLSNMVFLLILGAAVEGLAGGMALLGLYLCGGIMGGMMFLFFKSQN